MNESPISLQAYEELAEVGNEVEGMAAQIRRTMNSLLCIDVTELKPPKLAKLRDNIASLQRMAIGQMPEFQARLNAEIAALGREPTDEELQTISAPFVSGLRLRFSVSFDPALPYPDEIMFVDEKNTD